MKSCVAYAWRRRAIGLLAFTLAACEPSEAERARIAEQNRLLCLDEKCSGDVTPAYDHRKYDLLKIGGEWYIGPEEYYSAGIQGASFFWWEHRAFSKRMKLPDGLALAMLRGEGSGYTVKISMLGRVVPPEPTGYRVIQSATQNGWIAERSTIRPGFERVRLTSDAKSASGWRLDQYSYYIASDQRGPDGLPPVARCNHEHPKDSCTTGFRSEYGFMVGAGWNQRHFLDFPEIYAEVVRIYSLLEKAGQ